MLIVGVNSCQLEETIFPKDMAASEDCLLFRTL